MGEDKTRLVIGPFGSNLKTSDYRPDGVPLVFVRDIRQGTFQAPRQFVDDAKAEELSSHVARPGDVLITKMGDPPGDAAVYTGSQPAVITADCIRLRPLDVYDARYIAYAMETPLVKRQVALITSGVAQRKVSLARFRSGVSIPVPHIDEQRRIVDWLDDHLSRLAAAEACLSDARRRMRVIELAALARCRDGEQHVLADVAAIQSGIQKQPKRTPRDNPAPFLRVANVTATGLDLDEVHEIELFDGELERLRLCVGDLLVVEGNGSAKQIGRAALWNGALPDCVHQNHLIRVRPLDGLLPAYLEAVWNSPQNRMQLTNVSSSSSGLHTLSVSKLKRLSIPVPNVERQRELVREVETVRAANTQLLGPIAAAEKRSAALRRSVLAAAFSGRLAVGASDRRGGRDEGSLSA